MYCNNAGVRKTRRTLQSIIVKTQLTRAHTKSRVKDQLTVINNLNNEINSNDYSLSIHGQPKLTLKTAQLTKSISVSHNVIKSKSSGLS